MKKNLDDIENEIEKKEEKKHKRKHKKIHVSGKSVFKLQEIIKQKPKK